MKICVAQTRSVKGDIQLNIANHIKLVDQAVSYGADIIIFPELSLTGYEPELVKALATDQNDSRFDAFQKISDVSQVTIGVAVPTKNSRKVFISMILFQPHQARVTYSKMYLHPDEEELLASGQNAPNIVVNKTLAALAIGYELSIPEHAELAFKSGAKIYIASVAKFANEIEKALTHLSHIANKYAIIVMMANYVGKSEGNVCARQSSIWNDKGVLVEQLDGENEGILMIDTDTQQLIQKTL